MLKLVIAGILAATGVAATGAASAQTVPDATYSVAAYSVGQSQFINTPGAASSSGVDAYGYSSSSAYASGAQLVFTSGVSAGVDGPAGGTPQAIGDVIARYYFEITGPSSMIVPVRVTGGGTLSASGDGQASVAYSRYMGDAGGVAFQQICTFGSTSCGDFTYSDAFTVVSGDSTTAGMIASVQLRADILTTNGKASALIDPMIIIDPSFADASLYKITFSDGVTNGGLGAVPEPATWAMLIGGFGLVGFTMRRRRTIAARVPFAS